VRKNFVAVVAVLSFALTACSNNSADPSATATAGVAGPAVWSQEETDYLSALYDADLAASVFMTEANYVELGHTVCDGLSGGQPIDELLSAMASAGKENGLNQRQGTEMALTVSAASAAYLCPDQLDKLKAS
jgi:hypothetical protein